jgi:hypothetical protein
VDLMLHTQCTCIKWDHPVTENVLVPCSSIIGSILLGCREIGWELVDWILLALGRDILLAVGGRNLLSSCLTVGLSRTLFHDYYEKYDQQMHIQICKFIVL